MEDSSFNDGIILPPLLIQLRKILDQYPDDSQILKELIQNAEDAGARQIKFLFDKRTYGRDTKLLQHPNLAMYQGPSLYTYNDCVFNEADWRGIRMLSQSVKHDDPLKVGYFGMGFKSVFHLTDVPFVMSGDKLAAIDPQQLSFKSSSFSWDLSKNNDITTRLKHQVAPFIGKFDITEETFRNGYYDGTLFRFPLRQTTSKISDTIYSPDRIHSLIDSFKSDAHTVLIFLMHLETIEFYEQDEHGQTPTLTFRVQLSESCIKEVQQKRGQFMEQIKSGFNGDQSTTTTYPIEIETIYYERGEESIYRNSYLVTNYFSSTQVSSVFRKLYRDSDLRFPPWVGAALPLQSTSVSPQVNDADPATASPADGSVFCFLPLPTEGNTSTGLPVHVNGFFALEQNRKYIKMPGQFPTREDLMDKRLLWNQCMLKEVLPKAYAQLIISAIDICVTGHSHTVITVSDIYRAFPDFRKVDRQWSSILPLIYGTLFQKRVIHVASLGGRWVEPQDAIFNTLPEDEPVASIIVDILTAGDVNIAVVPSHVIQAVHRCCRLINGKITPSIVAKTYRSVQHTLQLVNEERYKLLVYFLTSAKYDLLDGLELLPLANGQFTKFVSNARRAESIIYIPRDDISMELIPGLAGEMLSPNIDDHLKSLLLNAVNRGYTQLKYLDSAAFASLLPRCLPAEWINSKKVLWNPGATGQPPQAWLQNMWTFLVKHCPTDMSQFGAIPIIPMHTISSENSVELVPLVTSGPILTKIHNDQTLPQGIQLLLELLGVIIVDELPGFIVTHPTVTKHYIQSPSYLGILKTMAKVLDSKGLEFLVKTVTIETSDQQKRALRELFNKISPYEMTEDISRVLSCLPIFEMIMPRNSPVRFASMTEAKMAALIDRLPVQLSRDVIDLVASHTDNLVRVMEVPVLNMADLLMQVVFPDIETAFYSNTDVDLLMVFVLRHYYSFTEQNPDFQHALRSLPFMARKGVLLTADRFYDPDDQLLQNIFIGEENFPFDMYADPTIVTVLRHIGLRSAQDVEPEDLCEACSQTEDMAHGHRSMPSHKVATKSDAILVYMEKHTDILDRDCQKRTLLECVNEIGWVKRLAKKPVVYPRSLPWYTCEVGYHKPCDMVQKVYMNVVGSVMPVVAGNSDRIANRFGWLNRPNTEYLIQHLLNCVDHFNGNDKALFLEITRAVYLELSLCPPEEVQELLAKHNTHKWVWHGDGFALPTQIVFQEPFMDLRPFTYTVPTELQPFSIFFSFFGAHEKCHLPDVLKQIKAKHDTVEVHHTSVSDVKRDLHLCITILNELKSIVTEETLPSLQDELVLPIHTDSKLYLKMAPLSECTYCDKEWMRQGYDIGTFGDEDENLLLVHQNLPIITSQALGVPTLMSRMLEADELDISFGQSDCLTHRLNVLLQEYVDGFAIPKELVQNADDAGATCVRFLYDERQNQDCRTCLIDEGMRETQGPALWVYNNAVFHDEDFDNITKLSGATKEDMPDKIGKFGLGFNAVYNITDVPSFVSRQNIVIFDPHTTHLGKGIRNKLKPGIKIDMHKHRRKLRRLANQFKPYNDVFGCDLRPESTQSVYNGTLFRLPLRTNSQAIQSEICKRHYDDAEVKSLLMLLVQGAENLLLFSQNVTEISIHHLPAHGRTPADANQIFLIHKTATRILEELRPIVPLSPQAKLLDLDKMNAVKQSMTLKAASKVVSMVKDSGQPLQNIKLTAATILSLDQKITESGSRLLRSQQSHRSQPWLITSCIGKGESLNMAVAEKSLIPVASVAVPLKHDSASDGFMPVPIVDNEGLPCGSVFMFMPLPEQTRLPVHLNAAFAVSSNRRHLVERSDEDKCDAQAAWNEALLRDPVCLAYIHLLTHLISIAPQPQYQFHMLWPNPVHMEPLFQHFVTNFYKVIADSEPQPKIISDGMKWVSLNNAHSLNKNLFPNTVFKEAVTVFRIVCEDQPSVMTDIPDFVRNGFEIAGHSEIINNNRFDTSKFFQEVFLPNISLLHSESRDILTIHALTADLDPESKLFELLKQSECIPTSSDRTHLARPDSLIDSDCVLSKLYSDEDGRFPHTTYRSIECLRSLRSLGMATSEISWSELLGCAKSIKNLKADDARKRIQALLDALQRKLESCEHDDNIDVREELRSVPFLSVLQKPEHYPVQWHGDNIGSKRLVSPNEAYDAEHKNLVGCNEYIIDDSVFPHMSDSLRSFLGINEKSPKLQSVLEQLRTISSGITNLWMKNNDASNELFKICFHIYTFLQKSCNNTEAVQLISSFLAGERFILCHDRFLPSCQVAFEFKQTCSPYLFSLPELFKRNFADFFTTVGVKQYFDTEDFVRALQSMHDTHNANILDRESTKLALRLVNLLNDSMQELNQTMNNIVDNYGTIYIPDANCVLRDSSELCFNEPDCHWVPTTIYVNYSHELIPYAISKQLGVNTKRQEVLRKHSKGIPFGQRERLPVRLKRILSSYPFDKEILKELLQNADDAGATEIHFIKDPRNHCNERVFDDTWKPLQGPALCVYNNKPFTDEDLMGIQRLGEGSKGTDPNKTGQYGIGFNCVYHLTDAPSFLTSVRGEGQSLCIFDPLASFVPGATVEEPGRRYDDVSELRSIFCDVFPCYLENLYDLSHGTMFRFPLRTPEMAAKSDISEQAVSLNMLSDLFEKFKQDIIDCLLFINKITTICLTEVDQRTGALVNNYTVKVHMSSEDQQKRLDFSNYLTFVSERIKKGFLSLSQIEPRSVTYELAVSDSVGYQERWLVTQKIGLNDGTEIPLVLSDVYKRQELALLPRGGVACLLETSDDMAFQRPKRAFCFLPLPLRTDLPVHVNGHFALEHEARRNLWSDDDGGTTKTEWNFLLLRHIIAPAYVTLLRHLPSYLDSKTIDMNLSVTHMLGDVVPSVKAFLEKLPIFNSNNAYWNALVKNVYQQIDISRATVLPVIRSTKAFFSLTRSSISEEINDTIDQVEVEWLTTSGEGTAKPYIDNLDERSPDEDLSSSFTMKRRMTSTPKKRGNMDILRSLLLATGFKLVQLPIEIYNSFVKAGVTIECVSPGEVTKFFKTYDSTEAECHIGTLPCDLSGTPFGNVKTLEILLEYCMRDEEVFLSNINGLPLLLCQDGQVRKFNEEDPTYLSSYHELLPSLTAMFTHRSLATTVFKNIDVDICNVFIRFDISSFGSLVGNEIVEFGYKTENKHVEWSPEKIRLPNARWIRLLWTFLNEEYERMLSMQTEKVEKLKFIQTILRPIRKWAFIPAHHVLSGQPQSRSQHYFDDDLEISAQYLVPVGIASTTIDYSSASIMSYPVRECLRKLGIPEFNKKLISHSVSGDIDSLRDLNSSLRASHFIDLIVASLEKPKSVLCCLDYIARNSWQHEVLRPDDSFTILKYFNDSISLWRDDDESKTILRKLPLFLTVHGDIISLGHREAFVLPGEIPQADMDAWERKCGIIFLRSNAALRDLFEVLSCSHLSVTEAYTRFIFRNFEFLESASRIAHLNYIKNTKLPQLQADDKEVFIEQLKALEFLNDNSGQLKQAFHFHDPYHPVYKVMLSGDAFPPPPFDEMKWLPFLKTIGLQHELTEDQFIEYAKAVAFEVENNADEKLIFDKSRTLMSHLFTRKNLLSESILDQVAHIRFIPATKPSKTLLKICRAHIRKDMDSAGSSDTQIYISSSEGIPESHEELIWTSCFLLPDWANPYKITENVIDNLLDNNNSERGLSKDYQAAIASRLKILCDPPVDAVVQHVQAICSSKVQRARDQDDFLGYMKMNVMKRVYKYLQEQSEVSDETKQRLTDSNCIAIDMGQTFVKPQQVVINLYDEDQIIPYLYKTPTELGEFKTLFLRLGATLNVTAEQYAMVLDSIHQHTGGAKLHPNEMTTAFKAVKELFSLLEKHPDESLKTDVLYLPSKSGRLVQSTHLVFNNEPSYTDRIRKFQKPFLVDLVECKLKARNYEDLVSLLPSRLRPIMLTSLVREILETVCSEEYDFGVTEKLKHQINSKAFSNGVIRLIRNEHRRSGHKVKQSVLEGIQEELKKVHVFAKDKIQTYLTYEDVKIEGSSSESDCFVERFQQFNSDLSGYWTIYITNSASLNEELLVSVAEAVNKIVGGLLVNSVHYLQPILSCSPTSIYRVLDRLKIRPDHTAEIRAPTLPTPGSFIPIEDHHLLREDFVEFTQGEYIGLELDDDESGLQTFIYAVVEDKSIEEVTDEHGFSVLTQKYEICVGEDHKTITALATDMYKFHRVQRFVSRPNSMSESSPIHSSFSESQKKMRASFYEQSSMFEPATPVPEEDVFFTNRNNVNEENQEDVQDVEEDDYSDDDSYFTNLRAHGRFKYKRRPRMRRPGQTENVSSRPDSSTAANRTKNGQHNMTYADNDSVQSQAGQKFEPNIDSAEGYSRFFQRKVNEKKQYSEPVSGDLLATSEVSTKSIDVQRMREQFADQDEVMDEDPAKLLDEISDTLEEAWKLSESQRKKIIKRLLLKWHPDKNIGQEEFATAVTQHIQGEIERLELGLPRPKLVEEFSKNYSFATGNIFSGNENFKKNFYNAYKFFYEQMNQRAKEHKEQRERYKENLAREYATDGYDFDVPPSFSSSNPQPAQAKRFLKQAQEDLRAADNDYDVKEPAYEWVCFKAHQASEKALKAAQFSVDAVASFSHDLASLAATVEDMELRRLALKLQRIVGDSNKLYNPDPVDFVIIPHDEYSKEKACDAIMCASDILERVKEFVETRGES